MKIKTILILPIIVAYFLLFNCNNSDSKKGITSISDKSQMPKPIVYTDSVDLNIENIQKIIQKSIDLPKLQQYFHIKENPDRSPLIILKSDKITSTLELNKFGKQVNILDKLDIEKQGKAYLIFTKISINQNTASINFSYPVEGISVRIEFVKKNNEWSIEKSELIEN